LGRSAERILSRQEPQKHSEFPEPILSAVPALSEAAYQLQLVHLDENLSPISTDWVTNQLIEAWHTPSAVHRRLLDACWEDASYLDHS
jgi:hypothetical protein